MSEPLRVDDVAPELGTTAGNPDCGLDCGNVSTVFATSVAGSRNNQTIKPKTSKVAADIKVYCSSSHRAIFGSGAQATNWVKAVRSSSQRPTSSRLSWSTATPMMKA